MVFTDLERQVIAIGLSTGEPPVILKDRPEGRMARFRRLVFGDRPTNPLADDRLEALRAMAAAVRVAPGAPDEQVVAAFLTAGWDRHHGQAIRMMAGADATVGQSAPEPVQAKVVRPVAAVVQGKPARPLRAVRDAGPPMPNDAFPPRRPGAMVGPRGRAAATRAA